jgi:hypothetical protein
MWATTTRLVATVTLIYVTMPYKLSRLVFANFYVLLLAAMLLYRPLLHWLWARGIPKVAGDGVLSCATRTWAVSWSRRFADIRRLGYASWAS